MNSELKEINSWAMEAAIRSQPSAGETVDELIGRARKIADFISGKPEDEWVESLDTTPIT